MAEYREEGNGERQPPDHRTSAEDACHRCGAYTVPRPSVNDLHAVAVVPGAYLRLGSSAGFTNVMLVGPTP
jgi:hypothetical protein